MKVYVMAWSYNHRGEFESGATVHRTLEAAVKDMKDCYKQAIINITPNGTHEELDTDECEEKLTEKIGGLKAYYYVERYPADSWEKAEVNEEEI